MNKVMLERIPEVVHYAEPSWWTLCHQHFVMYLLRDDERRSLAWLVQDRVVTCFQCLTNALV